MQIKKTSQAIGLAGLCALSSCSVLAIAFQKIPKAQPRVALTLNYRTAQAVHTPQFMENLCILTTWMYNTQRVQAGYQGPFIRFSSSNKPSPLLLEQALAEIDWRNHDGHILAEEAKKFPKFIKKAERDYYDALLSPKNL